MRTIAVLNQKGGVGKTTTVVNTAAALAAAGAKVLAIDFDPQAHLTIHLGLEPASINSGSYRVLTQQARVESEILMVRPNLWLLPANIDLVGAESELVSVVGREIILREALDECHQSFDYCVIDCAPSLGLLTLNALAAAQEVLIPLQPHFLALQGFGKLLQTVELVNRRINPQLKVNGILLCMFDSRASLPNEVKADIERFLNDARGTNSAWAQAHVLPVLVRRNIKLAEAPSYGQTIFEYEKNCHGAEDYQQVAEFIQAQSNPLAEPAEPVEIQQDEYQSEQQPPEEAQDEQPDTQPDYTNETQESYSESTDVQADTNLAEPQVTSDYSMEQQVAYSDYSETAQQEEYQSGQQFSEETEAVQPQDSQAAHTNEIGETAPENIHAEENLNQPEPETVQDYSAQNEPDYSPGAETMHQKDLQEQPPVPEESLHEQSESQPGYAEENASRPPFEIREIQSYSSPEQDQRKPASEEQSEHEPSGDSREPDKQGL